MQETIGGKDIIWTMKGEYVTKYIYFVFDEGLRLIL